MNEKHTVRIGVIGTNFVSDWLCEAAELVPAVTVTAVYSRKQETGDAFAAKHNIPAVFWDFEKFLSSDSIDAVYIASPNFAHAAQAIAAMEHGKHVLCEKVIATNSRELKAMTDTATANHRVLLEAMRPAFDPCLQAIRDNLPRVGKLRRVVLDFCQYSSRYDRFKNGEILNAFNPELSNAAVMDIGVYIIHVCAALFGEPKRILSMSTKLSNGFEGAGHVLLDYGDMKAELSYSKITDSLTPNEFMGEDGTLTVKKITMPHDLHITLRDGTDEDIPFTPADNNMIHELAKFAELVQDGKYDHPYLENSRIELAIIDEIRRQNEIVFPADNVE